MFRFGISFFRGGFRAKHGNSEIKSNAEIRGVREGRQAGTVVRRTKMIGKKCGLLKMLSKINYII